MAGKLTGAEKGETGTEPVLLGKAPPIRKEESSPGGCCCCCCCWEFKDVFADEDLLRLCSLEVSLLELRKMFLNDDMRVART